jgi:hypothetical protein
LIQLYFTYEAVTVNPRANQGAVRDGFTLQTAASPDETVSERFDLWLRGTDLETQIRALDLAFDYARAHQTGPKAAYVHFAINEAATPWRARLLGGQVLFDKKLTRDYAQQRARVGIIFERSGAWEGPETVLPVSNGNGTNVTAGLKLYNSNDQSGAAPNKRANYADIAGAAVVGGVPAPLTVSFTNTDASPWAVSRIYAGLNSSGWDGAAPFDHWYEAEESSYGAVSSDAACSGGQKSTVTLSVNGTDGGGNPVPTENEIIGGWALSAAEAKRAGGEYYHALVRFADTANMQLVKYRFGSVIGMVGAQGPAIRLTTSRYLQDMGIVQVPPALVDAGLTLASGNLFLYGTRPSTASLALVYDWLMLLPADNYRIYQTIDGGATAALATNDSLVDNPGAHMVPYVSRAGSYRHPWLAVGKPLMLYPGKPQRLVLAWEAAAGIEANPSRTATVVLSYRPRRLAL